MGTYPISEKDLVKIQEAADSIAEEFGFTEPDITGIPEGLQVVADEIGTIYQICFETLHSKRKEGEMNYDPRTTEKVPCEEFTLFGAEHNFLKRIKGLMTDPEIELSLYLDGDEAIGLETLLSRYDQQAETHTAYLIRAKQSENHHG